MPLSSCTFKPPAENKVDGVMEGVLEKGGEGDEAPSAEIEVRHRGRNRRSDRVRVFFFYYFPPGLDERSVTLA